MTNEEVAKKLAQITGKPITEFFNEKKNDRSRSEDTNPILHGPIQVGDGNISTINDNNNAPTAEVNDGNKTGLNEQNPIEIRPIQCITKVEINKSIVNGNSGATGTPNADKHKGKEFPGQLLELQRLFPGSKIEEGRVMYGRQMTIKEYYKYTKNMTSDEFFTHPLMYKIFRAEGQTNPNFIDFSNRFKKNDKK